MRTDFLYGSVIASKSLTSLVEKNLNKRTWFRSYKLPLQTMMNIIVADVSNRIGYMPVDLNSTIYILNSEEEMNNIQIKLYGKIKHVNAFAFASLSSNTMWVRADKATRRLMRHEFAHILLHMALEGKRINSDLHEHVAQFCEGYNQ